VEERRLEANPGTDFAVAHRGWPDHVLAELPADVESIDLDAIE
jgi:hypothetical protein